MYLDEIVAAQKRGEPLGITSICSAHPWVIKAAMRENPGILLIEATCNQVNQFGGYTGMTPVDFICYVRGIAKESNFSTEKIIFGGDHLGPSIWVNESGQAAMEKSQVLVRDYVRAGFSKIHLDASMRLGDDPPGLLTPEIIARRAVQMVKIAESAIPNTSNLRYVIGTEVPVPGGAYEPEEGIQVTKVADALDTIEITREAFVNAGLDAAWERVIALVVQPGVEFGDDFVVGYDPLAAKDLSTFIKSQPMVFEAHSTDYQTQDGLRQLVRDHFAILKVGPALTFALREAVFALAMMEDKLVPGNARSNIISVLEEVMLANPEHWRKYYPGNSSAQAFKRKYSQSDRIRYYWSHPRVQEAFNNMLGTLNQKILPAALLKQYVPEIYAERKDDGGIITSEQILLIKIKSILDDYDQACNPC